MMAKISIPSMILVIISALSNDKADLKYAQHAMVLILVLFAITFLIKKDLKLKH